MLISEVRKGDTIREPGTKKDIEVKKVDVHACSSYGVHINDRFCYERGAQVVVTRPSKKVEEISDEDEAFHAELDRVLEMNGMTVV